MRKWQHIKNAINEAKNILILTHIHADGDAIGSAFALAYAICGIRSDETKQVFIVSEETPPKDLSFIYDRELPYNMSFNIVTERIYIPPCDLAVAIDTSDEKRLGLRKDMFYAAPVRTRIDHHVSDASFADMTVCDTSWAATAEGIWELINELTDDRIKDHIYAKEIAGCVYAGILTDTGCFAYSNVTVDTHRIAAELIEIAGNMSWQYSAIYENIARSELALRVTAYNNIEYYADGKIAFLLITKEEMDATGATEDQIQSFAPFLRCIENVNVGIFAKPDVSGGLRISLRTDESCDASAVASLFGGGGHKRAAGLTYKEGSEPFYAFKERLIGEILKWME